MSDLSTRYPDHRGRRLAVGAVAALLFLSLLGWFVWSAAVRSAPPVAARVQSFEIASDTLAKAIVVVDRHAGLPAASCLVYAQAESYERVGELTIRVAAGGDDLTRVPVDLKTFKKATSVAVADCRPA